MQKVGPDLGVNRPTGPTLASGISYSQGFAMLFIGPTFPAHELYYQLLLPGARPQLIPGINAKALIRRISDYQVSCDAIT